MSGRTKAEDGVNRLLDIVVEEVSLVDRAANQQRFLIVKRSNDMDDTTTETAAATAEDIQDVEDLAADVAEENASDGQTEATEADTPLASALAALESLTEAVELLGGVGADAAQPRLVALAGELKTVSERLAGATGATATTGESADETTDGTAGATDGATLDATLASVRETLQRVSALVGNGASADAAAGKDNDAAPADTGVSDQLSEVLTELRALTGTVKEQQQRLARLEKRFGLPNSSPSGERPARTEPEDVGWPLDLNRPFDRESVDKGISFHDV